MGTSASLVAAHLPRRHPDGRLRRPLRRGLAVERLELRREVPHLHVACLPPGGHDARMVPRGADAVDAAVVRNGVQLQHGLPWLDDLRVLLVLAVAAIFVAVVAVAPPRLDPAELRQAQKLDAVVARLLRLRPSHEVERMRECRPAVSELVSQDVEAAEVRGGREEAASLSLLSFRVLHSQERSSRRSEGPPAHSGARTTHLRQGHSSENGWRLSYAVGSNSSSSSSFSGSTPGRQTYRETKRIISILRRSRW